MVHPSLIEARLGKLGFRASRWFKAEISELQHILMDNEEIVALACGRYFGSFALLVATDQRMLIIDKRVFFMTIEDIRYDMISEVDFNMQQVYAANLTVYTMNKTHKFSSVKYKHQLRQLATYAQRRIWEMRQLQQTSDLPSAQSQTSYLSLPQLKRPNDQPAQAFSAPQPISVQPNDYFADDHRALDHSQLKARVGHVAHVVGSAATRAAHAPHLPHRPVHLYSTGSLITRRPIGNVDY
ncbi:MAG TPA: PH domain-containing protein [Candidatus Saccharimonadales bacterium]|nr:PH domain-containing protein [Candidatus Saccharimonadales bacterium]